MPSGRRTSQTAVVRSAGGRSQKASLVTAATALATMLFLAPLLGLMPNATLAAIVIVYSVGLIQPAEFLPFVPSEPWSSDGLSSRRSAC
jgi:MFS superfamily sulfate permease-like transporter